MILVCLGCGASKPGPDGSPTDIFPSEHCGECPPWVCDGCGEMDSAKSPCHCWLDISTLNLADQKAVFASIGLSLS